MKWLFLFYAALLTGCVGNKSGCQIFVPIAFHNNLNSTATFTISTGSDSLSIRTNPSRIVIDTLCFLSTPKTDGNYLIRVSSSVRDTSFYWGYYTNGAPSEKIIRITAYQDSIRLNQFFH